ncbi:MAG TPA: hypothetical protein VI451_08785 [Anaerolineales bacterium]|nr:hypothetical protein [Anaerolineales bacterium]
MTEEKDQPTETPSGQKFFDNLFLLAALSILISLVVYNIWGIIELFTRQPLP